MYVGTYRSVKEVLIPFNHATTCNISRVSLTWVASLCHFQPQPFLDLSLQISHSQLIQALHLPQGWVEAPRTHTTDSQALIYQHFADWMGFSWKKKKSAQYKRALKKVKNSTEPQSQLRYKVTQAIATLDLLLIDGSSSQLKSLLNCCFNPIVSLSSLGEYS